MKRSPPQLFLGLDRVRLGRSRLDGVVGAGQGYHLRPARILSGRTVHVALLLHVSRCLLRPRLKSNNVVLGVVCREQLLSGREVLLTLSNIDVVACLIGVCVLDVSTRAGGYLSACHVIVIDSAYPCRSVGVISLVLLVQCQALGSR